MARPRIKIDQASFEKLCSLQCTLAEIAVFFGCSEDTIERWCKRIYHSGFAEVFAQKRNLGKIALRRSQFRLAEKNATMAIFLGKQYLGQREELPATTSETMVFWTPCKKRHRICGQKAWMIMAL